MSKEEAIRILEQVAAKFIGTLKEHQMVQAALNKIKDEKKETSDG